MNAVKTIKITPGEFLHQAKILGQLPTMIEAISTRQVIQTTAQTAKLDVTTKELQQAADQFRQMNQLYSAEATLAWFEKYRLSLDEFEEFIHHTILSQKVVDHLFSDQVEPYFYEHRLVYERAIFYEVIFQDEELALESFYAIQEAEISFSEVAREYIQDQELQRIGGYRGTVSRKDLKPELSAVVFASTPPTLLQPVLTAQGSHLIFVEEIIPAQLNEPLKVQIMAELFKEWLKEKVQAIEIDFAANKCE
ncbi:parvulin-like peptidyl-prolyl isomerase [Leptolyngbya sp. PCC 7375]|nr:parvulin-like peptidyl-prolyl isomerase [Leptolyngbya sp. PCC 7375]